MNERILTDTEKAVFERYLSFCKKNGWKCDANINHFHIMRETEKACYVSFSIADLREFDEDSGKRVHPDGTFKDDTYFYFWCPKKLMGYCKDKIPYKFVEEKISEFLNSK